jgi:hypothetical protein
MISSTQLGEILGLDQESLMACISDSHDLEDLNSVVNDVQRIFSGDDRKASLWFRTENPMLGDVEPREMIRHGRTRRLAMFVEEAVAAGAAEKQRL